MSSSTKMAALFCFVSGFLLVPTLGLIRFIGDNPIRTAEYADADLRTLFEMITLDLANQRQVAIEVPPMTMRPDNDYVFHFNEVVHDPNGDWIDEETGEQYLYNVSGSLWDIGLEQGDIRVMALEAVEEATEAGSSLRLDMTVLIDNVNMWSQMDCFGMWRVENMEVDEQYFVGSFSNVEIRYQTRFQLGIGGGQQLIGPRIDQSTANLNYLTVEDFAIVTDGVEEVLGWHRDNEADSVHVDALIGNIMSTALAEDAGAIDDLFHGLIGNRPFTAPQISLAIGAVLASGFICRRPSMRKRREMILYN